MKNYIKLKFLSIIFGAGNILDTSSDQFPNIRTYKNIMDGIVNDMITHAPEGSGSTWINGTAKEKVAALYQFMTSIYRPIDMGDKQPNIHLNTIDQLIQTFSYVDDPGSTYKGTAPS